MDEKVFKYESDKILFGLTIFLLISIFIIICDCDIPVIRFNSKIDRYIEQIFVHDHVDKTFYNIAISYVSAYIFFLAQVYIPSRINHKHSMSILKPQIEEYINNIRLLLVILTAVTLPQNGKIDIKKKRELYIVEEGENRIFKFTFQESFQALLDIIENKHLELVSNPMMASMDRMLCEILYSISKKSILIFANSIYLQMQKERAVPIKGNDIIKQTNNIVMQLQNKYGFVFQSYRVTDNETEIAQYYASAIEVSLYTSNEQEIKVKLS